jgi:hypothetical protein
MGEREPLSQGSTGQRSLPFWPSGSCSRRRSLEAFVIFRAITLFDGVGGRGWLSEEGERRDEKGQGGQKASHDIAVSRNGVDRCGPLVDG